MRLFELAYCCRLYGQTTNYDASIDAMRRASPDGLDLHDASHAAALLRWLNQWGCRQFALAYHHEAAAMLAAWGDRWLASLPGRAVPMRELDAGALEAVADAYADLRDRRASFRRYGDRLKPVTVGPTGTAKILHALRPLALPPWDDPIRDRLGYDRSRTGYLRFLRDVQRHVLSVEAEAASLGMPADQIPASLGRPASSLPKMIDEYHWVTIRQGQVAVAADEVSGWHKWSEPSPDTAGHLTAAATLSSR